MPDIKQLHDDMLAAHAEFKKTNNELIAEIKTLGAEGKESKSKIAELEGKLAKINEDLDKTEKALAKEIAEKSKPVHGDGKFSPEVAEKRKAFDQFLRKGRGALTPDQVKGLTAGVNDDGGYLTPGTEFSSEIIKSIIEISPIRQIARVIPIGAASLTIPKRTATFAATWVAETGARSETSGLKFGQETIPAHEQHAMVPLSFQLLEDSGVNVEQFVADEVREQFALAEGTAFVTGNGVGKPEGFTFNAAVLAAYTASGAAAAITADGLISLLGALKEGYEPNATWVLRRAALTAIRKLKDGNGQYLWQPGLSANIPPLLIGRPYILAADMPTVEASNYAVAVGDFRRGYYIVDRTQIEFKRVEDSTTINEGGIRIYARRRVGGQVVNAEAIKVLKIAAS